MRCPYCGNPDTRVIDSRPAEDKSSIRRRRSCDECGKRFTTYEKVETIPLIVIKKDNNREQYDRTKLEGGVLRACYKRPVSAADIQATIDSIETAIFSREEKEIPSSQIGEIVMESLKKLEQVQVRMVREFLCFKKQILSSRKKAYQLLTTELIHTFVKQIFVYQDKRVEIIFKFEDEMQYLMGKIASLCEGRASA